mmetsp:Transcript_15371/g.36461  ORF Transcript_15371/g.36461 Transcript_15371/m.36461 type:complete len:110 (-) Transcript_15371:1179-1508(-)
MVSFQYMINPTSDSYEVMSLCSFHPVTKELRNDYNLEIRCEHPQPTTTTHRTCVCVCEMLEMRKQSVMKGTSITSWGEKYMRGGEDLLLPKMKDVRGGEERRRAWNQGT